MSDLIDIKRAIKLIETLGRFNFVWVIIYVLKNLQMLIKETSDIITTYVIIKIVYLCMWNERTPITDKDLSFS